MGAEEPIFSGPIVTVFVFRRFIIITGISKNSFCQQVILFASGQRQPKAALSTNKANLSSLPEDENFLLAVQKQLLELPFKLYLVFRHWAN
jgi:hypothetical protein